MATTDPGSRPPTPTAGLSRTARVVAALDRGADRPWALPAVAVFPLSDYVFPFLPNQVLLVALAVLRPRRWWAYALVFVLATGFGAFLSALAVRAVGPWLLDASVGDLPGQGTAAEVLRTVERYGLWGLTLLALLPWPPRTAVLVCAMAGLPPLGIGLAVAAGRVVPAGGYALVGSRTPHLLRRIGAVDRVLREVEALRDRPGDQDPAPVEPGRLSLPVPVGTADVPRPRRRPRSRCAASEWWRYGGRRTASGVELRWRGPCPVLRRRWDRGRRRP
jgi:membrane protein YqaA with SNARE-associated domain